MTISNSSNPYGSIFGTISVKVTEPPKSEPYKMINISYEIKSFPSGEYVHYYKDGKLANIIRFDTPNEAQVFIAKQLHALEELAKRTKIPEPVKADPEKTYTLDQIAEAIYKYQDTVSLFVTPYRDLAVTAKINYRNKAIFLANTLGLKITG